MELKIPKYADWRNRSISECSTLLTKTQSNALLREVFREGERGRSLFEQLREYLLKDGWSVVEKHGDRIFLRVVLTYHDADLAEMSKFHEYARATGNWSFADWRNQTKPNLRAVK